MMLQGPDARIPYLSFCLRVILFVTVNLVAANTYSQLKAAFSSDVTEGCAPLIVHFKDESTGNPTAFKWYLGNNITPHIDKDPSTTYINPGTYTIKLVIRNAANTTDSIEKQQYIHVYATPVVNFRASDSTGCYPSTIGFTDLSQAGDGTIIKWLWDFGDGNTSTASNPSHEYTTRGNYNVTLRITNSHGCEKTFSKIEYIRLQSGVIADYNFTAPNTCKAPTTVTFNNLSSGTGTVSYNWQFGDNSSSTEMNPVHTYSQAGSFSIELVVSNNTGCKDTILKTNALNIGTVKAAFETPETVCEGTAIQLKNISAPGASGSFWEFGDGSSSNAFNTSKIYTEAGRFTIKLTSNFGSCSDVVTKAITVLPKPVAAFTAINNISCQLPFTVGFKNNSVNGVNYTWDFGDGSTSNQAEASHVYIRSGNYDVTLTVKGANGCAASTTAYRLVKAEPLEVRVLNVPLEGCAPLAFKPDVFINSTDAITSYEWDFGDGERSSTPVPIHIYPKPGSYTVKLFVKTAGGCIDSAIYKNAVVVGSKSDVVISATPRETCAFTAVKFTDGSNNPGITKWYWEFGDGGSSTEEHPSHNYSDTGYFPVMLTVFNSGCKSELLMKDFIHILPPVAKFEISGSNCSDRYRKNFLNKSLGATSWSWDFGDGSRSTEKDPEHIYSKQGTFKVSLTVRNDRCEQTVTREVQVIDEQPRFSAVDSVICKSEAGVFTVSGISSSNLNYVHWNYGDGSEQNIFSAGSRHSYQRSGTYDVTAIVYDVNGCTDTLRRPQYITVKGPVAAFNTGKNAVCKDGTIEFTDLSKAETDFPIRQWIWNYGEGKADTLTSAPFHHTYKKQGSFDVRLKVIDAIGCSDQVTRSGLVLISSPLAAFQSPDSLSCNNRNIRFLNKSSGSSLTYSWNFGDGSAVNTSFQPNHSYVREGNYAVKLVVQDSYGCRDSTTKASYIVIKNPKAAFSVNDSVATCPPLVTSFKNTSQDFIGYHWDFGDRTSSTIDNPTHFYNYPGEYTAKLIVTSHGGCQDTSNHKMIVRGPQGQFFYPDTLACVPATVHFKGSSDDNVTFIWDYNNGNTEFTTDSSVSYTYESPGTYYPKMILVDPQGCKVSIAGTHPLELRGVLAKLGLSKQVLCDSGLVQLKDQSVTYENIKSWRWTFGDGTSSALKDPQHYYKTPGEYPVQLNVITESGCRDTVDVLTKINVALSPEIRIGGPSERCSPATFRLSGEVIRKDSTALTWAWDLGNGRKQTGANAEVISSATGSTVITAIAKSGWGCSDTAFKSLTVHPLPLLEAGADTVVCLGNEYTIHADGADKYKWNAAVPLSCYDCATPRIHPADNLTIHVSGETVFGCKAEDSLKIVVKKPFKVTVSAADTICIGSSTRLLARGAERYQWSPSGGLNNSTTANPIASPSSSTVYRLIGSDDHHCFYDTAFVPVVVYPYPTVTAGEDKTIMVGNMIRLDGKVSADVNRIKWMPSVGLDCPACAAPIAAPKKTTDYTIEVSNQGGCTATDQVSVFVLCNQGNLFIPNTFSPNGDGNNDVFYPRGKGVYGVKSLKIFNRWGELVFERYNFPANDAASGWNGKFNGKDTGQDIYVYTIEIVCENNSILSFKGNVALLR